MGKILELNAVEFMRHYYNYEYTEREFNQDIERFKIKDLTWEELVEIFEGKRPDVEIIISPYWHDNEKVTTSAREFFKDLIQESMFDFGDYDCEGDGCDIEDVVVRNYEE